MTVLVVLMLAILLVAGAIVLYVAFPHRGEDVPGVPWLSEAMQRGVETVKPLIERPTDGTVAEPEREHADR